MPATDKQLAAMLSRARTGQYSSTNQWRYAFPATVQRRRKRKSKPKMPPPKACSYCGGKIGQGFEQITIPHIIQIRVCAPCRLRMYNWIQEQMGRENGDQATESKS